MRHRYFSSFLTLLLLPMMCAWTYAAQEGLRGSLPGKSMQVQKISPAGIAALAKATAAAEVWVDDDFTASTPGWGVDHFKTIMDGVGAVNAGGIVHVAAGSYAEAVIIGKPLSLLGAGYLTTTIDGLALVENTTLQVVEPAGNVTVDGFTVKTKGLTADNTFGITVQSAAAGAVMTFTHVKIQGVDDINCYDYGIYVVNGNAADVVFRYNIVTGTGNNPALIERCTGSTDFSNNTFDGGSYGLGAYYLTYDNANVTALQRFSNNTFDLGTGPANPGYGIRAVTFVTAYQLPGTPGTYSNIEIKQNHINNVGPWRRGFGLANESVDGTNSVISNVLVEGNTVDGLGAGNEGTQGMLIRGNCTNVTLRNNFFLRVKTGILGSVGGYGAHYSNIVTAFDNSFDGNAMAIDWPAGAAMLNASGNWLGSMSPAASVPANVDYTPWLGSNTDVTPGLEGFQGDFSTLYVGAASPQAGSTGRIQEGVNLVSGSTLNVSAGLYTEAVNANKDNLVLFGAGAGVTTINPANATLNAITLAANGLRISGFTLTGGLNGISGTSSNSQFSGLTVAGNAANGVNLVDGDFNLVQGNTISGQASGAGMLLSGARQNSILGNTIGSNQYNVMVEAHAGRTARGNMIQGNTLLSPGTWNVNVADAPTTTSVNFNVFGASDKYVRNASADLMLNATYNWFGGEPTPGPGAPDFSGAVDFAHNYATDPTIALFPSTYYMPMGSTVNIAVMGLIPAGTSVKGFDATLSWTDDVKIPHQGDPVEGGFFASAGNSFFDFDRIDAKTVRVNQSFLSSGGVGNPSGMPYVNVMFTQAFKAQSNGQSVLTLSDVQLRNAANATISPVAVDPPAGATLIADGMAPAIAIVIHNATLASDKDSDGDDDFVKNADNVSVTATITEANPMNATDIVANLSGFYGGAGHTAVTPASFDPLTGVATWSVTGVACAPPNGTISVPVAVVDLAGNSGNASDVITADNAKPTSVTGLLASPGHKKVSLNWSDASGNDANYKGVVIRYTKWNDYPQYASAPVFPANHAAGDGEAANGTGMTATHTFAVDNRAIYYYRAFVYDWAGNYSDVDGMNNDADRSTNYYLGDLGSGTGAIPGLGSYDGKINFDDLQFFSLLYFSNETTWAALDARGAEADFGPTVASKANPGRGRFAIPSPDNKIEFEDLMIFSMNYMSVAPKVALPVRAALAQELSLGLQTRTVSAGEIVATVHLNNDGREVKGCSAELTFDPEVLTITGVTTGDLFGGNGQGFYGQQKSDGRIRLDAALLGAGLAVQHSGDIATVHFRTLKSGDAKLALSDASVRGTANGSQQVQMKSDLVDVPATFDLSQNYPNPFNPTTVIKYQVPSPVAVEVVVYNVLGETIVTLVNEMQAAGYYTVEWNGRDSRNGAVPTGMYIYAMKAGEYSSVKKMMVVK